MGDRGNIVVLSKKYGTNDYEGVWLYSHWGGHRLEASARKALANSEGRIGDPSYLTRIIFCNMIADSFVDLDTGEMGSDLVAREAKREEWDTPFFIQMVGEFLSSTSFGIGLEGAGDQEYPTVCIDAHTGEMWLDESRPTKTATVVANRPTKED